MEQRMLVGRGPMMAHIEYSLCYVGPDEIGLT